MISHSDFGGRASNGYDFIDNDNVAQDCNGHGTHVAGTIAGTEYGVAKQANVVGVRVLGCNGSGTTAGVIAGVNTRPRVRAMMQGPTMVRAIALIHRWGPIAVTLSFFTVGLQTVVNAAAGIVRMPWIRYTLFMIPGCIAWAFIYATVGLAAFLAVAGAAAGSPWGVAAVLVAVLAVVAIVVLRRRRTAPQSSRATQNSLP